MEDNIEEIQDLVDKYRLTGTYLHYLAVCKTKLWYYHYGLIDNSENEYINLGSQIDTKSYNRKDKSNIGSSQIDFIEENDQVLLYTVLQEKQINKTVIGEKDKNNRFL